MTPRPIVGLLGGTFDPIHDGHVSIVESLLKSGTLDQLWLIPSFHPPHKELITLTSFEHRVAMLKLAFGDVPNVTISRIEEQLPAPGYTFNTLSALQKSHPEVVFYWCIGSDNITSFSGWYRYKDILKNWALLVAERPGSDHGGYPQEVLKRCTFIAHNPVNVSSTLVREHIRAGDYAIPVPVHVLRYIQTQKLYR